MIPFDEIDSRLQKIGETRAWLAKTSGRSADSIRGALAPKAPPSKRSELLQKALSDAILREEARQKEAQRIQSEAPPEIPAGHTAIYLSGQALEDADHASRLVGSPSLAIFCHDAIQAAARLAIAENEAKQRFQNAAETKDSALPNQTTASAEKYPIHKRPRIHPLPPPPSNDDEQAN